MYPVFPCEEFADLNPLSVGKIEQDFRGRTRHFPSLAGSIASSGVDVPTVASSPLIIVKNYPASILGRFGIN